MNNLKRKNKIRSLYKKSYDQQTFSSNGLEFDVSLVWGEASNRKTRKVEVSRLKKYFKQKNWNQDGLDISIEDVLKSPKKYIDHYKRLEGVLLDHPIVIWKEEFFENGRSEFEYHIVDGLHRLAHCKLNNIKEIEVVFLSNQDMKKCLMDDIKINTFEDLKKTNLDFSVVFLDNPIGSYKKFGSKKEMKLPFDYGEFSNFINPADNMGWDIIIVPSQSNGRVHQKAHNYVIVGIVYVNENEKEWMNKANRPPPAGNHKVIVSEFGEYLDSDVEEIKNFFKKLWQFEKPKFF